LLGPLAVIIVVSVVVLHAYMSVCLVWDGCALWSYGEL